MDDPCENLTGRLRAICDGTSGLSPEKVRRYMALLKRKPPGERVERSSGPGTELKKLLTSLGIPACMGCGSRAETMDGWGVEGCESHREEILGWLRDGFKAASWTVKVEAAGKAVATGFAFSVNPFDVPGSLLDEAIRRSSYPDARPPGI